MQSIIFSRFYSRLFLDMGGSLVKVVYFSQASEDKTGDLPLDSSSMLGGGRLHFRKFQATQLEICLNFIEQNRLHLGAEGRKAIVKATGGGAYK